MLWSVGSSEVTTPMREDAGQMADSFAARLTDVRARIDAIDRVFGHPVDIVAVTKGFDGRAIEAAAAGGCLMVGENYAQDLLSKRVEIESTGVEVHFIGQLQSNKVRQVADLVSVWESLDRASIVDEVARRAPGASVLIQVNATHEAGKGGCAIADVPELVRRATDRGLNARGLMAVGPTGQHPEETLAAFAAVRSLVDDLGLAVCSMGMSADLDIAVRAGSTQLRIGSALFGPRPPR